VFKLLLAILGGVGLEQVGTYHVMHHVHLMQQLQDALDVFFACFPNHFS
jgi:hypothetical protein